MGVESTSALSGPSWRLFEHGLLVFEREPLRSGGPSRMLFSRAMLCTARACQCRDITLVAVGLDVEADVERAKLTVEKLTSMLDGPEAMNARLDVDLGKVEPDDYEGRVPLSQEWVDYVQSKVDGDLLDQLYERWLRSKGWRTKTPQEVEWPTVKPGNLVGWHETHPDDRRDLYLDNDVVFMADDLYCVKPACTCSEVVIGFAELISRDNARSIGHVRIGLADIAVLEWVSPKKERPLLERLWATFQVRHHHLEDRLSERRRQMTELALLHVKPNATTPRAAKVGRNDPCPCGSGKKHKRCCAT